MKVKRLPQDDILLEVVKNLQEIIWGKITFGVKRFIKSFIENLLKEELTEKLGASRYERCAGRKAWGMISP